MSRYFGSLFFVILLLIKDSAKATEDVIPQIKVTHLQQWYVNSKYFERFSLTIAKHNATYNDVFLDVVMKVNIPADVYLHSSVYITDSKYQNRKLILEDKIPLCKSHPHHKLLPEGATVPDAEMHGECYKKNQKLHGICNNFKFEKLVGNIHEISDYHYVNLAVRIKNDLLANMTFYSEWGYLNIE